MSGTEKQYSPARETWRMFLRNKAAVFGLVLFVLVLLVAFFGPYFYDIDPFKIVWAPYTPPGQEETAPLGTDYLGRDMLAGLVNGGDATLLVGATAAAITVTIGVLVGAFAGYYGGWVDEILTRLTSSSKSYPHCFLLWCWSPCSPQRCPRSPSPSVWSVGPPQHASRELNS